MTDTLDILGVGIELPAAQEVRDLVRAAGGDPSAHEGWQRTGVAAPDSHPSTMATAALRIALAEAGVTADQLDLLIFVGVSRDYLPTWSVAAEVMREIGAAPTCLGFDQAVGCLGTLVGLNTALGWLRVSGGGYAAIISAERWSQSMDRGNPTDQPLWAHADGGGALVVGMGRPGRALATFAGAGFTSHADFNGVVLLKYGGTRFPVTPVGEPHGRRTLQRSRREIWPVYESGYRQAWAALQRLFTPVPRHVVCNQISPKVVDLVATIVGAPEGGMVRTGDDHGHVGPADPIIGLRRLLDRGPLQGATILAASAPYAFGMALLTAPTS